MRTDTTASDLMHREFLGVSESDALSDAAALLVSEGTDCLVVLRGGEPVGRLTARDTLAAVLNADDGATGDATVGERMEPPLPRVTPDAPLAAIEERLVAEGTGRIVVTDDGAAVGVITDRDVLAAGPTLNVGTRESETDVRLNADADPAIGSEPAVSADVAREVDRAVSASSTDASGSPTQGLCEVCGSLTPSLATSNGQAVCPDCQQV